MKIVSLCCFLSICFISFFFQIPVSAQNQQYFIVTAYYSPLPDQEYYNTGNYEDEVILNGQGIAGASGRKVFSGMLAAPGKYSFGTKIYLEGLGVGEVTDRGGAIVEAGKRGYEHDRIDIWMGYGEEGMRRANYWGKRKVAGQVLAGTSAITLNIDLLPSPHWAVVQKNSGKKKHIPIKKQREYSLFDISLGKNSSPTYIEKLQSVLHKIGYLEVGYASGSYDDKTIDAVFNFQLDSEILSHSQDAGAGSYGPKTRKKLKEVYNLHLEKMALESEYQKKIALLKNDSYSQVQERVSALGELSYGDISSEVRDFQIILKELGYFKYKDTAIYGAKTQNALIDFQIDKGIISGKDAVSAGIYGNKTRLELIYALNHLKLEELLTEHGLQKISSQLEEEIQEPEKFNTEILRI